MPLLDELSLAKLKKFQLQTKSIVEGFLVGLHKSPYHGFSVEFTDHRQYNPGESLRNLDWKIAAKTDRYYVKRYEEETNLRCYIVLDHSQSMFFDSGGGSKLDYATRLAGALSWLLIAQKDAVGLITFNDAITHSLPPKAYRTYLPQVFTCLIDLKPGAGSALLKNLHKVAESISKRSLIIVISDLLEDPTAILASLKEFRHRHNEVLVFHITDPQEEAFKYKHETEFVDSETGEKITVNPWQIRKVYLENYGEHSKTLKEGCHQSKIDYIPVTSSTPLNDLLLKLLLTRRRL